MIAFWVFAACAVAMVLAQDVDPGLALYHFGWYNALDAGLLVLAGLQLRRLRGTEFVAAFFGAAVVVFAGVAAGLMGPDTHTVVGAPGTSVRDADTAASFDFPLAQDDPNAKSVTIRMRRGNSAVEINGGRRYTGGYVLWQIPRTVVNVQAADAHGNHLTITQPTNASFLSPVLLMQQSTTIAGMSVRFDTFAVPAAQRNVKAVLFSAQQAAQLRANPPIEGTAAVLFDVAPGGIGLIPSGGRKLIGGLQLAAQTAMYPGVTIASAPYLPVAILGLLIVAAALARLVFRPSSRL